MAIREMLVCGRRELCTAPPPPFYLLVWCYNPRRVKDGPLSLADVCNWPAAQKIVTYFDPDSTYLKEEQQQNVLEQSDKKEEVLFIFKCYRVIQPLSLDEFVFKCVRENLGIFLKKRMSSGSSHQKQQPQEEGKVRWKEPVFFFFLFFFVLLFRPDIFLKALFYP